MIGYGDFATQVVNFVILAWIVFLIVKMANRLNRRPEAAPSGPSEVDLLTEIRDELKKR
jgi:large conductance mechanosensitive channel